MSPYSRQKTQNFQLGQKDAEKGKNMKKDNCYVNIREGRLMGNDHGAYQEYLNVPYASDGGRFKIAKEPEEWTGIYDATKRGPVFPQAKGRLSSVMGNTAEETYQSESAFTLNIWTPDTDSAHPVLFWMHGGAFMTGGGAIPWYSGEYLAKDCGIVVVNVSYRLGVLGNLFLPSVTDTNLSVHDVNQALLWVHKNIAEFGGDPDNITIAGQSAGAWYAVCMMGNPALKGMFAKAGLFSFNGGTRPYTLKEAERMTEILLNNLKIDDPQKLMNIPAEDILKAQKIAVDQPERLNIPFLPVTDMETIGEDYIAQAAKVADPSVAIFCGTVAHESTPFVAFREGESEEAYLERVQQNTEIAFEKDTERLLRKMNENGNDIYRYRFAFESAMPHVHACHCFDIPFLLRNFNCWEGAPFLNGIDRNKASEVSDQYSSAFVNFMRYGNPMENWSLYDGSEDSIRIFR